MKILMVTLSGKIRVVWLFCTKPLLLNFKQ